MALNISVDSVNLDNGTDRLIYGQPINDRSTSGVHLIRVNFKIEAATTAALQALWDSTKTAFVTKDKRVIFNYDDGAGTPLEDLEQGVNTVTGIITSVTQIEGIASSANVINAVLDVVAALEPTEGLPGQVGEIVTTKFLTAANTEARTVTAQFGNSDDGLTSAAANYAAARASLLTTFLGVDSDGGRDGTTGLAKTGENVQSLDEDENLVIVTLSSEEIPVDFSSEPALRGNDLIIKTIEPENWSQDDAAGERPTVISVSGRSVVDQDALSGSLHDVWVKIRSNVESILKSETGLTDISLQNVEIDSNQGDSTAIFSATYLAKNTVVLQYSRTERETEKPEYQIWVDANGCEVVQKRPGDNPLIRTITVDRIGVGLIDLDPGFEGIQFGLIKPEVGFYILRDRDDAVEGPNQHGDLNNVFFQQSTFTYLRTAAADVSIVEVGA